MSTHSFVGLVALALCMMGCLVASAEVIVDDFDDGVLGPMWEVTTQRGGAFWNESGGTLNGGGTEGESGSLFVYYKEPLGLIGEVLVDYGWVSCTGHKARVGIGVSDSYGGFDSFGSFENSLLIKCLRTTSVGGNPSIDATHFFDGAKTDYESVLPTPESTTLKIERSVDSFTLSYLGNDGWHSLLATTHDFGDAPVYAYLYTSNSNSNPGWEVTFDNFRSDFAPPGDLNGDGVVNSRDVDIVRAWWGIEVEPFALDNGDATGDGLVNSKDLDLVRSNWGAGAAVPEPGMLMLLGGCLLMVVLRQAPR